MQLSLKNGLTRSLARFLRRSIKNVKKLKFLNKGGRYEEQVKERRKLVREISDLVQKEKVYWRQRSRAIWLFSGDRNSKFFHRIASQRRKKNSISYLMAKDGTRQVGDVAVGKVANDYFQRNFSSSQPMEVEEALEGIGGGLLVR